MRLKLHERESGPVTVVDLEGQLVFGDESDALRAHLKKLIKARRTSLVFTLDKLTRLDSVGIGTIMDGVKQARSARGDLHLAQLSKTASDVLGLLGLTRRPDLVRIFPDEQEAVTAFQSPPK